MKIIWLLGIITLIGCNNSNDKAKNTSSTDLIIKSENEEFVDLNLEQNDEDGLYEMIGKKYNSKEIQNFTRNLGEMYIEDFSSDREDYLFKEKGIQFSIRTTDSIIRVIFLYNYKNNSELKSYSGKIPFGVSFSDSLEKLDSQFGENSVLDNQGFYGRTFQWKFQDSLKMSMEVELPRNDNDKMFIEFISLSKKRE